MNETSKPSKSLLIVLVIVVALVVGVVLWQATDLFGGSDAASGPELEDVKALASRIDGAGFDCSETFQPMPAEEGQFAAGEAGFCQTGDITVPLIVTDDEEHLEAFTTFRHFHPHLVEGPNWKVASKEEEVVRAIAEELDAKLTIGEEAKDAH